MQENYGCRNTQSRIGILIAQLGSPAAPTKEALRPYLKQFLSDSRVIEINRLLWWMILNGIILNTRPKRSARLYQRIWEKEGSPLLTTTVRQTSACQKLLLEMGLSVEFEVGMRYGTPSLESAIDNLIRKGCDRLLLFPMYPQYSASTTASTYDIVFSHLLKRRSVPTLKVVSPYYNRKEYIEPLVVRLNEFLSKEKNPPERIIISYHGVPVSYVQKGDPYCCQCVETTAHFIEATGKPSDMFIHCFQSRFGKEPWLNPYTDETIEKLGKDGLKRLAVMCPGFVTDCLETLDEIGNEAREAFEEAGGESLKLIPCLNDHPAWIEGMAKIIKEEIAPWTSQSILAPKKKRCPVMQPA